MAKKDDKWMQGAVKHPGALTKKAKAAGAYHDGKIDASWEAKKAKGGGTTGRQARLAETFKKEGRKR